MILSDTWASAGLKMAGIKLLVCFLLCSSPCKGGGSVTGRWVGWYELDRNWVFMRAEFGIEKGVLIGTADIYENLLQGDKGITLQELAFRSSALDFKVPRNSQMLAFNGKCAEDRCVGEIHQGLGHGVFRLQKVASLDPKIYAKYVGTYRLSAHRYISVWPIGDDFGWDQLGFVDLGTGRIRVLFPRSQRSFFAGTALWVPYPTEEEVTFVMGENREVKELIYREGKKPGRAAPLAKLSRENVSFHNGGITLVGTLVMPPTKGPHPAVVLVHGSGAISRNYYRYYADNFALHGIAVLSYDKRGVGESTGDWHGASLADLAEDALAGVQFLRTRGDINQGQIGLWGSSQGGWIAPLAASKSKEVAFVISRVGPGVSPAKQGLQNVEYSLRAEGFSEQQIARALELTALGDSYARTGQGWDEYKAARDRAEHETWFASVEAPDSQTSRDWEWRRVNNDFDPEPIWENVTCPVLALFGEKDTIVPPISENLEGISRALVKAGNHDFTIKIVPGADHLFWVGPAGGIRGWPHVKSFAIEAVNTMTLWLERHVSVTK